MAVHFLQNLIETVSSFINSHIGIQINWTTWIRLLSRRQPYNHHNAHNPAPASPETGRLPLSGAENLPPGAKPDRQAPIWGRQAARLRGTRAVRATPWTEPQGKPVGCRRLTDRSGGGDGERMTDSRGENRDGKRPDESYFFFASVRGNQSEFFFCWISSSCEHLAKRSFMQKRRRAARGVATMLDWAGSLGEIAPHGEPRSESRLRLRVVGPLPAAGRARGHAQLVSRRQPGLGRRDPQSNQARPCRRRCVRRTFPVRLDPSRPAGQNAPDYGPAIGRPGRPFPALGQRTDLQGTPSLWNRTTTVEKELYRWVFLGARPWRSA